MGASSVGGDVQGVVAIQSSQIHRLSNCDEAESSAEETLS